MAPRTRYFFVGSGLVVAVGLCTGLVAYYSGNLTGASAARAELSYVPQSATGLAYADVADIFASEFHQHLRQFLPSGEDKARFQAETGVDIERDVDSVLVAMDGSTGPELGGLVLVRGRFDQSRIEAIASGHGAVAQPHQDVRLLIFPSEGDGGAGGARTPCIAFLEPGLIAFGTHDDVRQAIDASRAGSTASRDAELMAAVADIERKGNAWFVTKTDAIAAQPQFPEVLRQQISGVRWLSAGADIDRDVRAFVRAETRDPQAAQDLRAVVNGALAAARLMANQDARLASALSSIHTSGSGSTVELEFTVPAELLVLARDKGAWHLNPR